MPEYFIRGTQPATVEVQYLVIADDEVEALRKVHHNEVLPMIIGVPKVYGSASVYGLPRVVG